MSGSLRERKKAATESALQKAALDLFEKKGYDATTIEEIVAEADVSRRTFFRYFGSKEEVVFKGTSADLEVLRRLIRERPAGESDLAAVKSAVVGFVKYMQARRAPVLEALPVIRNSATLRARGAALQGMWTLSLAEELARRHERPGAIRHRLLAAIGIATIAAGMEIWEASGRQDLGAEVASAFECLEDGSIFQ